MNTRTAAALVLAALATATLTACEETSDSGKAKADKPAAGSTPNPDELTDAQKDAARKASGLPARPTGKERQDLLDALAAAAPEVVRYKDKAIDAARNQCSALNGGGNKLDWTASQRFTYKDVTTTEAQGAKINQALKDSGFCKV
ncbi:hypothetical protein [Streptomyces fructofermentans]|uniref:Lipoprotein n=1 Tax=Streptomyces fructofermentans TaxID=152141 RepID=A0A918NVK3_9ACTN|nr:hypothetical protein [Streptomyces fructofermentans]GGX99242.1 hypothetical protein GCM10010515_76790 [Streptomyces fructofermentans]